MSWLRAEAVNVRGVSVKRHHALAIVLVVLAVVLVFALGVFAGYQYPYQTTPAPAVPPGQTQPTCDVNPSKSHQAAKQLGMGSCLPNKQGATKTGSLSFEFAADITGSQIGPDLSNNDPVYSSGSWAGIAARSSFAFFKVNQGDYYIDRTAAPMAAQARAHGLTVGGYDFLDVCHQSPQSEADVFVRAAAADGLLSGKGVLPPTADAEYPTGSVGCNARDYVYAWLVEVHRLTGRWGQMYTGAWWADPHLGCWWPGYSVSWISGYTSTANLLARYMPCGLHHLDIHQYADAAFNGAISSDMNLWRLGASVFRQLSGATAPPDPYGVFPKTRFALRFGVKASEYNTYKAFVAARCKQLWRRPVCTSSGYHLRLLRDRQWFVAHHVLTRHGWRPVKVARWSEPKGQPLGSRFAYFSAAIVARHPTPEPKP